MDGGMTERMCVMLQRHVTARLSVCFQHARRAYSALRRRTTVCVQARLKPSTATAADVRGGPGAPASPHAAPDPWLSSPAPVTLPQTYLQPVSLAWGYTTIPIPSPQCLACKPISVPDTCHSPLLPQLAFLLAQTLFICSGI